MILRASLALALASAADPSFLVGTAPEVLPNCTAYGGALCADGGAKVMVRDAAADKLVARYTFDDGRGLDSSGHGLHARVAPVGMSTATSTGTDYLSSATAAPGSIAQQAKGPASAAKSDILVQGGSLRTWSYRSPLVEQVQVVLSTEGRPLDADIELWHGPDLSLIHI